jgi:hypothetical protein
MFLFKATVFYWVVWATSKALTTYGSFYYPQYINRWYDWNHRMIEAIPNYGPQFHALMRDNVADGTLAFWEVWIVVGLLVSFIKWITAPQH